MHLFLSYCKSHIYELHALLSATITFFLMFADDAYTSCNTPPFAIHPMQKIAVYNTVHMRKSHIFFVIFIKQFLLTSRNINQFCFAQCNKKNKCGIFKKIIPFIRKGIGHNLTKSCILFFTAV